MDSKKESGKENKEEIKMECVKIYDGLRGTANDSATYNNNRMNKAWKEARQG